MASCFRSAENTFAHDLIATRLAVVLVPKLSGAECTAVACRAALTGDRSQSLINPLLLAEVLSPKTSGYDYSAKFDLYRTIESFCE